MTLGAQLFGIAAMLPSLALILLLVRRGQLRIKYALLWIPVGVAMLGLSVVPGSLNWLADLFGIAYPPTLLFVLAISLLIFVTVHLSWELSRTDERIRLIAEQMAISSVDMPADDSPDPVTPRTEASSDDEVLQRHREQTPVSQHERI